jgi:hypothetical protein
MTSEPESGENATELARSHGTKLKVWIRFSEAPCELLARVSVAGQDSFDTFVEGIIRENASIMPLSLAEAGRTRGRKKKTRTNPVITESRLKKAFTMVLFLKLGKGELNQPGGSVTTAPRQDIG